MPSGVKDIQLLELKDTISQLNKTISTQNELISSLQKMLEERNAKDSEKDLLIANLQSQLAYLKNKVFGSTSEIRHDQLDGQLNLFGTPVGDEKPAEVIEPEVISVKGYTKERKPKATYDDKYNSVRSICKHFFTDIVGLSIKFFCVSLRHMSIGTGPKAAAPPACPWLFPHRTPAGNGQDGHCSPVARDLGRCAPVPGQMRLDKTAGLSPSFAAPRSLAPVAEILENRKYCAEVPPNGTGCIRLDRPLKTPSVQRPAAESGAHRR